MNYELAARDRMALRRCAGLLEATGRASKQSTVALNSLTAAHLLSHAGIEAHVPCAQTSTDRDSLHEVLELLGGLSTDALRDEDILDALHQAFLAHMAAR